MLVISFLILLGCDSQQEGEIKKVKKLFPKAVHNTCTDKWAIQTGIHSYFGEDWDKDSANTMLGMEFQYPSKDSAMKAWTSFVNRTERIEQIRDSIFKKNKHYADSIFECNHTYQ